jgi:hypothetical protein
MTREQKFEAVGGLAGAAVAYFGVAVASAIGWVQLGLLSLVITVPAGVVFGWIVAKLLSTGSRILRE